MIKLFFFKQFILACHLSALSLNAKEHSLNDEQFYLTS